MINLNIEEGKKKRKRDEESKHLKYTHNKKKLNIIIQ
jgi:hypothetical protein